MLDLWPRVFIKEGLNYDQIFSPIIKPDTVLSEDVFVSQPEGFAAFAPHLVCKLQKPLYGLKLIRSSLPKLAPLCSTLALPILDLISPYSLDLPFYQSPIC